MFSLPPARKRNIRIFWLITTALTISSCVTGKSAENRNQLKCYVEGHKELNAPPSSAKEFRNVARRHPNDKTFGPPPRQQLHSGKRWDRSNEFWFTDPDGRLHLLCNTDDSYIYFWTFESLESIKLVSHGLLNRGN